MLDHLTDPLLHGFLLGVLAHVCFKWASWKNKENRWMMYWKDHASLNIASGIAAIVSFSLWKYGILSGAFGAIVGAGVGVVGASPNIAVEIPLTFETSIFAGYVLDSIARHLWGKFGNGQAQA